MLLHGLDRYTASLLNSIRNFYRLLTVYSASKLSLIYIEMDMNTLGMGGLVISLYKKYGALLFEGAVQLTLFPENKDKTL